jgi:hypothetical protein
MTSEVLGFLHLNPPGFTDLKRLSNRQGARHERRIGTGEEVRIHAHPQGDAGRSIGQHPQVELGG